MKPDLPPGGEPPPEPDFIVTGDGNPSPNGNYFYHHGSYPNDVYRRDDNAWDINYFAMRNERTLTSLIPFAVRRFKKPGQPIPGTYTPVGTSTGTAYVAAPP